MIIVVDDEDRENEGDFIMPADMITPEAINFMITHGRGLVCAPLSQEIAKKLDLPLQVQTNTDTMGTAFTVTIDAKEKVHTGISASDRSHTLKFMANPESKASDFTRPGHIFPLIAKDGGVIERQGHTEAAVDFAKLSGMAPVGVMSVSPVARQATSARAALIPTATSPIHHVMEKATCCRMTCGAASTTPICM